MKLSSVCSIHNRSKLFKRALLGYMWQSMNPRDWEIILVDDLSTEDLRETYKEFIGKINLTHCYFDHTRHRIFKEMNPGWVLGAPLTRWYHTPALTTNCGVYLTKAPYICLGHPEMLRAPDAFDRATYRLQSENNYIFGMIFLGDVNTNKWLDEHPSWTDVSWYDFLETVGTRHMQKYGNIDALYWYDSYVPKLAIEKVGGVDFTYMRSVAAEDDDFRDRIGMIGYPPIHDPYIHSLHQNHDHEQEFHRRRDTPQWKEGLERSRRTYRQRRQGVMPWPIPANTDYDWTAKECITKIIRYEVGSITPSIEHR